MELRDIIAANIVALRKHNKMTQLELAEKVNYSDKAVSRWESGDVTPDIATLQRMAIVFNVTIPKLLEENLDIVQQTKEEKKVRINKLIITLLAIAFVWTMATIIFIYSMIINALNNWVIFIYAFPVTFLIAIIFNTVWGNRRYNYVLASILIWTILLSAYIAALDYNIWPIFILGAPLQVLVILWSKLHS